MMLCPSLIALLLLGAIAPHGVAADEGDDISNNLFTDLAPLLALFGEKVTLEFFSQSMGWADCILLAMAPLGIVPIIISAIRVGGPTFLKAIIGRGRENLVAAEMEIMPSTSNESCELYNGADVVKCQGTAPIWEFICLIPPEMKKKDEVDRKYPKASIMTLRDAVKSEVGKLEMKSSGVWAFLTKSKSKPSVPKASSAVESQGNTEPAQGGSDTAPKNETSSREEPAPRRGGSTSWFCWFTARPASPPDPEQGRAGDASKPEPESSSTPPKTVQSPGTSSQAVDDAVSANSQPSTASTLTSQPGITIIRNTDAEAPNVSLNRPKDSDRGELHFAALLGIIIQLVVIMWFGLISFYWKLKKDGESVVWHAPRLTIAGTVILVVGMLICSRIVDTSTREKRYRAVGDQKTKLVWLQQETTVSDQVFGSLALSPPHLTGTITYSSRAVEDKLRDGKKRSMAVRYTIREWKTVVGVAVSLSGFVIQFVGIRGMHFSASIAQLISVFVMASIRALVRRKYNDSLQSHNLVPQYELDFLAISLGDLSWAPWCKLPDDAGDRAPPGATVASEPPEPFWHVVTGDDSPSEGKLSPTTTPCDTRRTASGGLEVPNRYSAQGILTMRRDLGQLANWRGPAARQAARLTEAIESVMNNLFTPRVGNLVNIDHMSWPLKVHRGNGQREGVHLRLFFDRSTGGWRAQADDIEATLSLWLYSAMRTSDIQSPETDEESKSLSSDDDSWLREKSLRSHQALRQLGPYTPELYRDLRWWLPRNVYSVLKAKRAPGTAAATSRIVEIDESRVLGYGLKKSQQSSASQQLANQVSANQGAANQLSTSQTVTSQPSTNQQPANQGTTTQQPTTRTANQQTTQQTANQQTHTSREPEKSSTWEVSALNLSEDESVGGGAGAQNDYVLATMSHEDLEQLYAMDLFNAFMWAAADQIQGAIDEHCETQPVGDKGTESWKHFTLRSERLTKLVQDVQASQLMTLDDAFLSVIPPLSGRKKLPELYGLVETAREKGRECERRQLWARACSIYVWLWNIAKAFPKSSYVYRKAAVVLLEYLYSIRFHQDAAAFNGDEDVETALFGPDGVVATLSRHLGEVEPELLSSLRKLYKTQRRSWPLPEGDTGDQIDIKDPNTVLKLTRTHCKYMSPAGTITTPDDPEHVNAKDILDWTPAHYAANRTRFGAPGELVRSWVVEGADLSMADFRGWTPLHYACCNDDRLVVEQFLERDADPNRQAVDGMTPVHCAALYGTVTSPDPLIRANARLDAKDIFGRAPIHLAALGKWPMLIRAAISIPQMYTIWVNKIVSKRRDQLDARDRNGRTPLHLAAANGCHLTVESIIRETHDQLTVKDNQGRSPLHLALLHRCEDKLIDSLLTGPRVSFKDKMGKTPIDIALRQQNLSALKKLLVGGQGGAVVHMACDDWMRLLRQAEEGSDRDVAQFVRAASTDELKRRMVQLFTEQQNNSQSSNGDNWERLYSWTQMVDDDEARSFIAEAGQLHLNRQISERMQRG